MAIHYFSPDKESRARAAIKGLRPADSAEAKSVLLCADKKDEAKVFCVYEKLGGAFEGELEKVGKKTDEETTDDNETEEPKKRGRPAKVK